MMITFEMAFSLVSVMVAFGGLVWALSRMLSQRPTYKDLRGLFNDCPKGIKIETTLAEMRRDISELKQGVTELLKEERN